MEDEVLIEGKNRKSKPKREELPVQHPFKKRKRGDVTKVSK
jgi:hypothetical protein